ncbi:MAG TPA: hypothetical protein VJ201_08470 [Candidatus Babeliales bacterium]|nr:hypothetical protein [Candidatus Babeliales bacterium]
MFKKLTSLFTKKESQEKPVAKASQQEILDRMKTGAFTLDDFAQQMSMMDKIGSVSKMLRFMPGMGGIKITPQMLEAMKVEMKKIKLIISNMTPEERANPHVLTEKRKGEIARKSGVAVSDINGMLKRFEETKQFAKMYGKK